MLPQYDIYTDSVLDLDALVTKMQEAIRKKEWRKAEHYATLITLELGEIATREELARI